MSLFLLILCFLTVKQTVSALIKSVNLTTSNTNESGAIISISSTWNPYDVWISNDYWGIYVTADADSQRGYHLQIALDNTWGYHPSKQSIISLTIYSSIALVSNSPTDLDLLLSFSVNTSQYITYWLALDNMGTNANTIYPGCDTKTTPTQSLASGDVNGCVEELYCESAGSNLRDGKANGGNTGGTNTVIQPNNSDNDKDNKWPITIQLINNPITNTLLTYINEPSWGQWNQGCAFGEAFATNLGLMIYIALDDDTEYITFDRFEIEYSYDTDNPTPAPTDHPTDNPTNHPTVNPIDSPSNNPSHSPTNIPTNIPTKTPSKSPTINPTKSPALLPTTRNLVIGMNDPTVSPIMVENDGNANDKTSTISSRNDLTEQQPKKSNGVFTEPGNIVILILSILIGFLLCIIGVYLFKKYKKRATKDEQIIIQISTKNISSNSSVSNAENASVAVSGSPLQTDSDNIDNAVSGFFTINTEEGNDGMDNMFITDPTPNGRNKVRNDDIKRESALSMVHEDMYNDGVKPQHKGTMDTLQSEEQKANEKHEEHNINITRMDQVENSYSTSCNDEVNHVTTIGNTTGNDDDSDDGKMSDNVIAMKLTDIGDLVADIDS